MSETYADYGQEQDRQERFGGVLLMAIGILAGVLVLAGLILFSLWALILRRSHDRNRGKPAGT